MSSIDDKQSQRKGKATAPDERSLLEQEALINGLQRGEAAAQEQLLQQYAPRVFKLIVRMTRNSQDAEELTQDTLLRAINQLHRYDPTQASFASWLHRIAYRLTLNHLRRRPAPALSLDAPSIPRPVGGGPSADELTSLLSEALNHLPPDELTLINLFYYDDLPLSEIAFITESPPGTIATRLHRIRKKLYHIIQKLKQQ